MSNQPTKQPLDHWFNRLRNSAELSEDQVRKIIASSTSQRRRFPIVLFILSRRFIMVTVLLSSLIAGAVFIATLGEEGATPQRPSPSWGKAPTNKVIPAQPPPSLGNLPRVVPSRQVEQSSVQQPSPPLAKPTVTEPPHILQRQGIVALELTTEELAKIGIQMLPDGGMRLYAGMPNVNFFRGDSHIVEAHTAIYTITADSETENWIPRQFTPAGINWINYSLVSFYTENGKLRSFHRIRNEEYDRHINFRPPKKTDEEEEADRRFWDSVTSTWFADPVFMRWAVPVTIKLQQGKRIVLLWLSARRIAPYLPDRYRIPIEAEIKRLKEIDDQQAKELSSKEQTIISYEFHKIPNSEYEQREDTNASVIQQHRLMQQARPGEPVMEVWWQSAGAVMVLNITPNPARDVTELTLMLDEPRIVALDLYRYDGQRVKRLTEGVSLTVGQHQLRADLRGIQPGLYLLGVTTDRGEQALRRVYVMQ